MTGLRVHFARLYGGSQAVCGAWPRWQPLVRAVPARAQLSAERQAQHLTDLSRVSCGTCLRSTAYRVELLLLLELVTPPAVVDDSRRGCTTPDDDSSAARLAHGECVVCGLPADTPGPDALGCPCHTWPLPTAATITTTEGIRA